MNFWRALIALTILVSFLRATPAQERLVPERGLLNSSDYQLKYEARVRSLLLQNAARYYLARVVCLTVEGKGEWVVTVVRKCGGELVSDHRHSYYLEYVEAEKHLRSRNSAVGVKVKEVHVDLDRATSEALEEVWRRMLRMARYPKKIEILEDAEIFHFSRAVPQTHRGIPERDSFAGFESGQAWSPVVDEGLVTELVKIGRSMQAFALAQAKDRERIKVEINVRLGRLNAKLGQSKQLE